MAGLLVLGCVTVLYMATGLQTAYQLTQYQRGHFSEPERLEAVWNPWFWGDRQALYRQSRVLTTAIKEQDVAAIQAYLVWSSAITARLPRTTLLHNHAVALLAVAHFTSQDDAASTLWLTQLQLNYPRQRLFKDAALAKVKAQLAAGEVPRIYQHLTPPVGSATYY